MATSPSRVMRPISLPKLGLRDYNDVQQFHVQISEDGKRIWVNINGVCSIRVYGYDELVIEDQRKPKRSKVQRKCPECQKFRAHPVDQVESDSEAKIKCVECGHVWISKISPAELKRAKVLA